MRYQLTPTDPLGIAHVPGVPLGAARVVSEPRVMGALLWGGPAVAARAQSRHSRTVGGGAG
jgi:hypothetical protein